LSILSGWGHTSQPLWSLGLQLAFFALLRKGAHVQANYNITSRDDHVHLYLGQTKMSFRNAGVDAVHFGHHHVAELLQAWKAVANPEDYLIHASACAFRCWFAKGLLENGLDSGFSAIQTIQFTA
jgi:hypothetical protein